VRLRVERVMPGKEVTIREGNRLEIFLFEHYRSLL
jgi:hypothetical protein